MIEALFSKFNDLSVEELEEELTQRNGQLCKGMTIEDLDILVSEIEVLEFLLKKKSECIE